MELSIIIPCKNEERYIGKLLDSILVQEMPIEYEIIIADANSSDKTLLVIDKYRDVLPIKVIEGGLPSFGRNNGARVASGDIFLFLDADCYFDDKFIIFECIKSIIGGNYLVGVLLDSRSNLRVKLAYYITNLIVMCSKLDKPFVVGGFFMIKKDVFWSIGGFDVELMHCEDYFLSSEVNPNKFYVVKKSVYFDDRRFKKFGFANFIIYFIKNLLNKNNKEYFKKDIGYWS
jgi:glycosyltransferase involved in cell wall biosynthesis